MRIRISDFKGLIPKTTPKMLPDNAAVTAQNCRLVSKRLEPLKGLGTTVSSPGGVGTIYKYGSTWLSWSGQVDVAPGPIADDTHNRIYHNSGGVLNVKTATVDRAVSWPARTTITGTPVTPFDMSTAKFNLSMTLGGVGGTTKSFTNAPLSGYKVSSDDTVSLTFNCPTLALHEEDHSDEWPYPDYPALTWTGSVVLNVYGGGTVSFSMAYNSAFGSLSASVAIGSGVAGTLTGKSFSNIYTGQWNAWDNTTSDGMGGTDTTHFVSVSVKTNTQITITFIMDRTMKAYLTNATKTFCYYVQTYVDELGQESPPSAVSALMEKLPNQAMSLTLGADPGGNITLRRIYRTAAGSSQDDFFFVAEVADSVTTYTDSKDDTQLAESMPLTQAPPSSISGLCGHANGVLAAYSGKTLYFCEPWMPYSWPDDYQLTTDYTIKGLASDGTDLVVLTEGTPYLISGSHPEAYTQHKLPLNQACVSKLSVAVMGRSVIYASPDGLVQITGARAQVVTEAFFSRQEWQAIGAITLGAVQDNVYYLIAASGKYIFDFGEGLSTVTTHDIAVSATYSSLVDDVLYVLSEGLVKPWGTTTDQTLTWKSKVFTFSRNEAPSAGRVIATGYPITFKVYSDNTLRSTITVSSSAAFRIPKLTPTREWQFEVIGAYAIDEIRVGTSMGALR